MSTRVSFNKYHGTGNDFIIIDNRNGGVTPDTKLFAHWCDRRFGIGADGVILLVDHTEQPFAMDYYNADGMPGSMCGNGGRCFASYLASLDLIDNEVTFMAYDGPHKATISDNMVSLQMADVALVQDNDTHYVIDTGSPHYITFVEELDKLNVQEKGAAIRNAEPFKADGINVNFVEAGGGDTIRVRTYERGVEAETQSCGTGVVACALAQHVRTKGASGNSIVVQVQGGELNVRFEVVDSGYREIYLEGPATHVYSGTITVKQ